MLLFKGKLKHFGIKKTKKFEWVIKNKNITSKKNLILNQKTPTNLEG